MNLRLYSRLAIDNVKKNARTVLPYMIAGILSVLMYFVITSMAFNEYIYNYETGMEAFEGAQMVAIIMEMCSGIIAFFSVLFLLYANRFIMRNRKKELGLYGILGLAKYHIAIVMALESLFIMGIVIAVGLGLGIFLNKLMLLLLYKILNQPPVSGFFLNTEVVKDTLVLFVVIYLAILIYNVFQVNVSQPIALLRSEQTGEKEPKIKWGIFLLGVLTLAGGYGLALSCNNTAEAFSNLFVSVLLVIVGTYCLFIAGSIFILKQIKKNKRFYYQAKNFVSVSGLIYRMKHNAAGLAAICVLSTGVILLMACGISLFMLGENTINQLYPRDIGLTVLDATGVDREEMMKTAEDAAVQNGVTITESVSYEFYDTLIYREENHLEYREEFTTMNDFFDLYIVTQEEYNRITGQNVVLNSGEILVYHTEKKYDEYILPGVTLKVVGEAEKDVLMDIQDSAMALFDRLFMVVPDEDTVRLLYQTDVENAKYAEGAPAQYYGSMQYYGYNIDSSTDRQALDNMVNGIEQSAAENGWSVQITVKEEAKALFYGLYGGAFFVGIFLSIFFLVATVLIIYYKQISEGFEDRKRYEILEKVGMTEAEVKATIHRQVMLMFFLPVGTAILHMLVATKIIRLFLSFAIIIDGATFMVAIAVTSLLFLAVYTLVYRITAREYYKIVYRGI
uniref:ABC transporter permease n=1 Tax=Acetatifactor sp. TaxID=1872090 RepID=UPI0040559DDF